MKLNKKRKESLKIRALRTTLRSILKHKAARKLSRERSGGYSPMYVIQTLDLISKYFRYYNDKILDEKSRSKIGTELLKEKQ